MTACSKEHEALAHYPVAQLDSGLSIPWWGSVGSMAVDTDSNGQLKSTDAKQAKQDVGIGHGKGVETLVNVSWGDAQKTEEPHPAVSALPNHQTWLEIGYAQPMICAKYPYKDQGYGLLSTYGPQIEGRMMLPLSLTTDEGPIYVNAKQYHGIIRRRQTRARAEMLSKPLQARKPYLHKSRHLHAKRRARGAGGRFLNAKDLDSPKEEAAMGKHSNEHLAQPAGSQNSEVLQSESRNPAGSVSEVSSVYSRGDFGFFHVGIPHPSPHYIPNPIGIEHAKWAAAGTGCWNLKV